MESEKMKALVEKILDVSKGEIKSAKNKYEFSLTELIEEIIEDLFQDYDKVKNYFK